MSDTVTEAREAILAALWKLYRQKPLDQILVTEVTRAARVYRTTFYRHFDDLRDALNALEDGVVADMACRLKEALSDVGPSDAQEVARALRTIAETHAEHAYFFRLRGERRFEERLEQATSASIRPLFDRDLSADVVEYLSRVTLSTLLTSMAYAYGLSLSEAPELPYQSTMRIFMGDIVPDPQATT